MVQIILKREQFVHIRKNVENLFSPIGLPLIRHKLNLKSKYFLAFLRFNEQLAQKIEEHTNFDIQKIHFCYFPEKHNYGSVTLDLTYAIIPIQSREDFTLFNLLYKQFIMYTTYGLFTNDFKKIKSWQMK